MSKVSPYHGMPLFYYSGSKKWEIKSDREWIQWQLKRLPQHMVESVCEQYDTIFNTTQRDREITNTWLKEFCDFHGCTTDDLRKRLFGNIPSEESKEKANRMVGEIKSKVKRRSILDMHDEESKN